MRMKIEKLKHLVANGKSDLFYTWAAWHQKREEVLQLDKRECQLCKAKGKYRRGDIVHHVKHLKDRPDLALSIVDPDTGERQLITVCKQCHSELHPESMQQHRPRQEELTAERWD